mgnify:CR=1 FL=1
MSGYQSARRHGQRDLTKDEYINSPWHWAISLTDKLVLERVDQDGCDDLLYLSKDLLRALDRVDNLVRMSRDMYVNHRKGPSGRVTHGEDSLGDTHGGEALVIFNIVGEVIKFDLRAIMLSLLRDDVLNIAHIGVAEMGDELRSDRQELDLVKLNDGLHSSANDGKVCLV